jgi:hypothetical protein
VGRTLPSPPHRLQESSAACATSATGRYPMAAAIPLRECACRYSSTTAGSPARRACGERAAAARCSRDSAT